MTETKRNTNADRSAVLWIAGVLLLLVLSVIGGLYWSRTGKIHAIQFEGLHYTEKKQLQAQATIPLGIHPDSLNLESITQKMEQLPYVKRVVFNPQPGGTMVVQVIERKPIALLINGSHRAYVDADGIQLPLTNGEAANVPLLYGFSSRRKQDTLQSDAFKQTSRFLQELTRHKASDATVSEIAWNDDKGVITLTNSNGVKVIFGKNDFANRLRNWQAFCRAVIRKKGIDRIQSVDLRFKGQIVTHEK